MEKEYTVATNVEDGIGNNSRNYNNVIILANPMLMAIDSHKRGDKTCEGCGDLTICMCGDMAVLDNNILGVSFNCDSDMAETRDINKSVSRDSNEASNNHPTFRGNRNGVLNFTSERTDSSNNNFNNEKVYSCNGDMRSYFTREKTKNTLTTENTSDTPNICKTGIKHVDIYDSSTKPNVKVTTMFSNSFSKLSKPRLISDPSPHGGIKPTFVREGKDSAGCYHIRRSLEEECGDQGGAMSGMIDGLDRRGVSQLRSRDSLLSLHQHTGMSSSTNGSDEEKDDVSVLENYDDYDMKIMDRTLERCVSLDIDSATSRTLEDGTGNRLLSQLSSTAHVTSDDITADICRERNTLLSSINVNNPSVYRTESVTLSGCSRKQNASCAEDKECQEIRRQQEQEDSLHDSVNIFSVSTKTPEHDTGGAASFSTQCISTPGYGPDMSGSLNKTEDYRNFVDTFHERQYLTSLEQSRDGVHVTSSSSARGQISFQNRAGSEEAYGSLHLEVTSSDILPRLNPQRRVIHVPAELRRDLEIDMAPQETFEPTLVTEDVSENTQAHQGSMRDKSELRNLVHQCSTLNKSELNNLKHQVSRLDKSEFHNLTHQDPPLYKSESTNQHMSLKEMLSCLGSEDSTRTEETSEISTSGHARTFPQKLHNLQPFLLFRDYHRTDIVVPTKLDDLIDLQAGEVTTQRLDIVLQKYDHVTKQELDTLVPAELDDVTNEEFDALIPDGFEDVTSRELDALVALEENNITGRKLDNSFAKDIQTEYIKDEDGSVLPVLTNRDLTVHIEKNRTRNQAENRPGMQTGENRSRIQAEKNSFGIQTCEQFENVDLETLSVQLEKLPVHLEELRQLETGSERQPSYIKSLSVTSRDSGFDSQGSPVDTTHKIQEHRYSAFTDPIMELSF